jgi:hypothetical protein
MVTAAKAREGLVFRATEDFVKLRSIAITRAIFFATIFGVFPITAQESSAAAQPKKPAISEEASAALLKMGQTLRAEQYSFQVRTIRVYADPNGDALHIFHTMKVVVHRPNRLLVEVNGDDGENKLVFDGKNAVVYSAAEKKYASVPVPEGTIQAVMQELIGRLGVDFPLADFLAEAPNKAFLTGVTAGRVVGTVTIDGSPYLHLFFTQPPGIELELWLAKSDQSLPKRLIVTYRNLPGQPSFVAEFSDWNFDIHPSDADFAFQPPSGATPVELRPVAAAKPPAKHKGGKP